MGDETVSKIKELFDIEVGELIINFVLNIIQNFF